MKHLLLVLLLFTASCELSEVVTASADDVVVAEVYLRTDGGPQTAWLHRTLQPDDESTRVPNARVEVTRASNGAVLEYEAAPDSICIVAPREFRTDHLGSCYTSVANPHFNVVPGERYDLRITLADGGEMTSVTRVPGDFEIRSPAAPICTLPPATLLELEWTTSEGAWVYAAETHLYGLRRALADREIFIDHEPLRLFGLSVSSSDTTIMFPSEFGLFDRFNEDLTLALAAIQPGLPPEVHADVVVAAADRNYVNWERGGTFNPSGLVRIASIRGAGTGAFGSLVIKTLEIYIGEDGLPSC